MPLFVILFEYLAEASMTFWHIRHFCRNFPFSPKICHFVIIAVCQDFPLCHLIWGFAKPLMDSCYFRENCQLPIVPLLLSHLNFLPDLWWILAKFANFAKYIIFVRPTIIGMPLFSSSFNQGQVYKYVINSCQICPLPFSNRKVKKLNGIIRYFHIFHNRPCFA